MRKLLLAIGALLPLALVAVPVAAHAQDYTYDCLCLYSDSRGTCVQYTCDSYQRPSYYRGNYCNNSSRYGSGCRYSQPTVYDNGYQYYDNAQYNNQYYNNYNYSNSQYYDSRYNYDWYYRRYTNNSPSRRYYNQYYDNPMYYY